MRSRLILLILMTSISYGLFAQETVTPNDVLDIRSGAYAFTNATIIVDPQTTITVGTLLIKNGTVVRTGQGISTPNEYVVYDLEGKYVYPSLIDLHTNYGLAEVKRSRNSPFSGPEVMLSTTNGAYNANEAIKSHYNATEEFVPNEKEANMWRSAGFGTVLSFRPDGVARGTGTLVTLGKNDNEVVLLTKSSAHYSFSKGTSKQSYPFSLMGFIALLRQTYLDAEWYKQFDTPPFTDQSLEGWITSQSMPQIFDAGNWLNVLRADKVGDEFGVQYIIKSGGDEYQRIDEIRRTNAPLIVPVNFPDAFDVEDPMDAEKVSLTDMKHWELAPSNLARLDDAGIRFAITSEGLKKKGDLLKNVRRAIEHGLPESRALAALTTTPAQLIKMNDQVGSLKNGRLANFIITSGPLFADNTIIYQNWVQGNRFEINPMDVVDFAGMYDLSIDGNSYSVSISGEAGKQKAEIKLNDTTTLKVDGTLGKNLVNMSFSLPESGRTRLSGWSTEDGFKGRGQLPDGSWIDWTTKKTEDASENGDSKKDTGEDAPSLGDIIYPFVAYGNKEIPTQETLLFKNATVWTNEEEGVLDNTDVLIKSGKISAIGKDLTDASATVIDASGKHLTSGIIDEHTHMATSAVNDIATNSSMVRIGDILDSEDIDIYRALSGGVTAAQVLHGSANPVGGQSGIIKMRWGKAPEELKIQGADPFIKFALGENVKRSRNNESVRFPQTRMGVEQVYVDGFTNALEYEKEWKAYNALSSKSKSSAIKPRRDLVDETMLEIINKERFISCHSYVQSEINMLMKVAENFNFKVNTFTHILEGYKVADKMAEHGVGGSTFSDWWNYKWEVRYAIPYNAAIMHREGVVTAINSDDNNIGRRLNQEAAKSIKYGGLTEEETLKMVTLNPAKLLHLDDRMGSIKVGKDGDVVLWSDNPLSVYAVVEKTVIDGTVYFDRDKDELAQAALLKERARLIQKMKSDKSPNKRRGGSPIRIQYDCDWDVTTHLDVDWLDFEK